MSRELTDSQGRTAAQIRAAADPAQLLEYVHSNYPPIDEIPPSVAANPENYLGDLPVDLDARIAALSKRLSSWEGENRRRAARYNMIRSEGLSALNNLELMYFGQGDPRSALNSPLLLLHSQLCSDRLCIPYFRQKLQSLQSQRQAAGEQLSFF